MCRIAYWGTHSLLGSLPELQIDSGNSDERRDLLKMRPGEATQEISLDDPVGSHQQRLRDGEVESGGRGSVDEQFEARGMFEW